MEIREARADELDAISEVLRLAWDQFSLPTDAPPKRLESFTSYKAGVPDVWSRADDGTLLVAADHEGLAGTVTYYRPGEGEDWPPTWAAIRLLGVHPRARGLGIGRALTDECVRRARDDGATHLGLHTSVLMDIAKAMYARMGFVPSREHDFRIDDDFVVEAFVLAL